MSNHTKGPWSIDRSIGLRIGAPAAGHVAHILRSVLAGNPEDNANITAASPAMYAAIEKAVHCFDVLGYQLPFDVQDELRAALASARGETPNA